MKSTNLGNVAIANVGVKKSPFPRNRNVYTSCGFGEVQPLQVLHCDADTDSEFSIESKMYLEPIVAPTYGHCKCEFWSYFVEYSDLFDRFKEIFSETPKPISSILGSSSVPTTLPWCYRSMLSTLMLWGSFLTVYKVVPSADGTRKYTALVLDDNSQTTDVANELQALANLLNSYIQTTYSADASVKALDLSTSLNAFGTYGLSIDARTIIECPTFNDSNVTQSILHKSKFTIPLANPDMYTLVDYRPSDTFQLNINLRGVDITPVSIRGADVLIERPFTDSNNNIVYYAFAFRLNAFGKRIYKVFKGAGFQEDFYSYNKKVSLMPIFAVYKAYYECFGLLAYTNYESTSLASLLYNYASSGAIDSACSDFNHAFGSLSNNSVGFPSTNIPNVVIFKQFVLDLGSMWVTDAQDFVSAQETGVTNVPNPSAGQNLNDYLQTFSHGSAPANNVNMPSASSAGIQIAAPGVGSGNSQHLYINEILHGQLESEVLKKMYQLINVETIAGKRVEQLLRAQGYGEWVDHCKARFIAHDEFAVEFSQVTSLSDTLNPANKSGMILGERGGRGEAYNMGRTHKYKNDEAGFLVTLMAVVPDAGYTNTLNPAFDAITKYDFYTPVFDGVGKELLEVNQVVGEMPTCLVDVTDSDLVVNKTDKSFGVSPRGSKWKVTHNTRNGVFALRSVRDSYLPYILDKVIKMGDVVDTKIKDDTGTWASTTSVKLLSVDALQYFPQKQLPLAGLAWRYPTRYPWIGMFSRIFAVVGDAVDAGNILGRLGPQLQSYEFLNSELDGFDVLNTVRMTTYEHKLPITDSYETLEEGNEGKIDTNISKA